MNREACTKLYTTTNTKKELTKAKGWFYGHKWNSTDQSEAQKNHHRRRTTQKGPQRKPFTKNISNKQPKTFKVPSNIQNDRNYGQNTQKKRSFPHLAPTKNSLPSQTNATPKMKPPLLKTEVWEKNFTVVKPITVWPPHDCGCAFGGHQSAARAAEKKWKRSTIST